MKQQMSDFFNSQLYQEACVLSGMPVNNLRFLSARREFDVKEFSLTVDRLSEMYDDPGSLAAGDLRALALAGINSDRYNTVFATFLLESLRSGYDAVFELYCLGCAENPEAVKALGQSLRCLPRQNIQECVVALYAVLETNIVETVDERMHFLVMGINRMSELLYADKDSIFQCLVELIYAADAASAVRNRLDDWMYSLLESTTYKATKRKENNRSVRVLVEAGFSYETLALFTLQCVELRSGTAAQLYDARHAFLRVKMESPYRWSEETKSKIGECLNISMIRELKDRRVVNTYNYDWLYSEYGARASKLLSINMTDRKMYGHLLKLDDEAFADALLHSVDRMPDAAAVNETAAALIKEMLHDRISSIFSTTSSVPVSLAACLYLCLRELGITATVGSNTVWRCIVSDSSYYLHEDWLVEDLRKGYLSRRDVNSILISLANYFSADAYHCDETVGILRKAANPAVFLNYVCSLLKYDKPHSSWLLETAEEAERDMQLFLSAGVSPLLCCIDGIEDVLCKHARELAEKDKCGQLILAKYGLSVDIGRHRDLVLHTAMIRGLPDSSSFCETLSILNDSVYRYFNFDTDVLYCMLRYDIEDAGTIIHFISKLGGTAEDYDALHEKLAGGWLPDSAVKSVSEVYSIKDCEAYRLGLGRRLDVTKSERKLLSKAFESFERSVYKCMLQCWEWSGRTLKLSKLISVCRAAEKDRTEPVLWLLCHGYNGIAEAVSKLEFQHDAVVNNFDFISEHVHWKEFEPDDAEFLEADMFDDRLVYGRDTLPLLGSKNAWEIKELCNDYPDVLEAFGYETLKNVSIAEIEAIRYNLGRRPMEWYASVFSNVYETVCRKFDWDEETAEFEEYVCESSLDSTDLKTLFMHSMLNDYRFRVIKELVVIYGNEITGNWKNALRFALCHSAYIDSSWKYYGTYMVLLYHEVIGDLDAVLVEKSLVGSSRGVYEQWVSLWKKSCAGVSAYMEDDCQGLQMFDVFVGVNGGCFVYLLEVDGELAVVGGEENAVSSREILEFAESNGLRVYFVSQLGSNHEVHFNRSLFGGYRAFGHYVLFEEDVQMKLDVAA